jgi:hypothetical protein
MKLARACLLRCRSQFKPEYDELGGVLLTATKKKAKKKKTNESK